MSIKRYKKRTTRNNDSVLLTKMLEEKNIIFIKHYSSPTFKFPTYDETLKIPIKKEIWKFSDSLSKYAEKHYKNPELWWVIGMFNKKPTDAHFKIGDEFYIPLNIDFIFDEYMRV
jgi:hypothetical protein